jgi:hypothetical protein
MTGTYQIHSELRAGHWVAWVTGTSETKPSGAILLVGQTQEEAEANARKWVARLANEPHLLRK